MDRMGVEYQRFDGKEYVSLKRYYNLLCKCKALEKENKNLEEMCGKLGEMNGKLGERVNNLEEENKKLKEELSKKSMENWFDKKAKNIFTGEGERYKSQKENILMGKIC